MQGSQPVGLTCSGSNSAQSPSTSTTQCSSTSSWGVNFNITSTGLYEVCFSGNVELVAAGPASKIVRFRVFETSSNNDATAAVITSNSGYGGGAMINFSNSVDNNVTFGLTNQYKVCNLFNWSSTGNKTVRLFTNPSSSGVSLKLGSGSGLPDPLDDRSSPEVFIKRIQ